MYYYIILQLTGRKDSVKTLRAERVLPLGPRPWVAVHAWEPPPLLRQLLASREESYGQTPPPKPCLQEPCSTPNPPIPL